MTVYCTGHRPRSMESLLLAQAQKLDMLDLQIAAHDAGSQSLMDAQALARDERTKRIVEILDEWIPLPIQPEASLSSMRYGSEAPADGMPGSWMSSASSTASGSISLPSQASSLGGRTNSARGKMQAIAAQLKDSKYSRAGRR